ncbi:MAG TPA: D-aminoacyl-tRNA deacylase, partial [Candidatus Binatus sp.]|nr:D-aminoacyl-tRNA deacylase [Candidatus Binatus sp.]
GFGGTHYSGKLTKMNLEGEYSVGHLVPKYAFEAGLSETVLKATFDKTVGGCKTALVDWKGLKGRHREWLIELLTNWDIEVVRC